jgi:hypothetical protein
MSGIGPCSAFPLWEGRQARRKDEDNRASNRRYPDVLSLSIRASLMEGVLLQSAVLAVSHAQVTTCRCSPSPRAAPVRLCILDP